MIWTTLHNMFLIDPTQVTLLEKIFRPIFVYAFLIVGLRLAGKRELAQMNPFDLVVLLTLSNTVQNAIIGNDNSVSGGMVGAATLLLLNWAVVRFSFKNRRIGRIIEGRPDVLVKHGQLIKEHLEREMISKEELIAAAHRQGIGSLHDVEHCLLEPNGTLTFVQRQPTPDTERHNLLMQRLAEITAQLQLIKNEKGAGEIPKAT